MRSLVFVALATVFLSVAMGISVYQRPYLSPGRQIASFRLDHASMKDWFCEGSSVADCLMGMGVEEMRKSGLLRTMQTIQQVFSDTEAFPVLPAPLNRLRGSKRPETLAEGSDLFTPIHETHAGNTTYPYFGFLPIVDTIVKPGAPEVSYHTPCFDKVVANALQLNSSFIQVQLTASGHKTLFCSDSIVMMGGGSAFGEISGNGVTEFLVDITNIKDDPAQMWLVNNRGIAIGHFPDGFLQAALDLISTIVMMIGFAEPEISGATFQANTDFVRNYVEYNSSRMGAKLKLRDQDFTGQFVAQKIDPAYIESGDTFIIIRPDGLDPMIAWAEGGSAGHTTIAMRAPNGTLFVCETTTHDSYWPTNGIQCHEWSVWYQLAHASQYNVVMLPMAPEVRANFNVSAAWDFFYSHQGLNYGFLVLLSGWLDVKHGDMNSPCVPPDFTKCLNRPLMERVCVLIDEFMGNGRENLVRQMFSHRVGLWPAEVTAAESIMYGHEHLGLETISDLYSIVEQDDWEYNTTRYGVNVTGRSMVCNVFVCNMLKHGGVFSSINSEIQCGESNLWTLYSSQIWDTNKMGENRPKVCRDADPTNPLCQMMGNWTMHLHPNLNERPIYANMSNHCPSVGPNYYYPETC